MKKLSVVVGRFQVAKLHAGHKKLIDYANQQGNKLLLVLGTTRAVSSSRNPLSFEDRKQMMLEEYPNSDVQPHPDHPSDHTWSENLDQMVADKYPDHQVQLCASRDSFAHHYHGKHVVVMVPEESGISGTEERLKAHVSKCTESFRQGKIASNRERFPTSFQCVDIAVVQHPENLILLGRKLSDPPGRYRFPGGFVDPTDPSLEYAAARELSEEVPNILTHELKYLGSFRSSDYRYRGEPNQIMTALFLTYKMGGGNRAGDDLAEVRWMSLEEAERVILPEHKVLLTCVVNELSCKI